MTSEEAIEELRDASDSEVRYGDTEYHYDKVMKRVEAFDMAIKALEQARPNGKWKRISPAGIYECTNCNQIIMTSDIDCYKYCHGCGVRMEGEE